jgi:hypothetical protein
MAFRTMNAPAPDLSFHEPGQGRVSMSAYWRRGPAVFVFLRHFG